MTQLEIRLSSSFYRVCKFEVLVSLNVSAWVLIKERNHARRILRVNKVNHFVFVACENEMNFKTNQSKWWNFSTLKLFSTRLWRIHYLFIYLSIFYLFIYLFIPEANYIFKFRGWYKFFTSTWQFLLHTNYIYS